jgi:alpha-L-rhamnosidase
LSIGFNILKDEEQREKAAETSREIIRENDYLVGTGFAGTAPLGFALKDVNATDDFY